MRPKSFDAFHGQKETVKQLKIIIESSKKRSAPIDHMLFHGQPGLGKTTLAQIVANETSVNIVITSGQAFSRSGDLASVLASLSENDILFIDEVHQLSLKCQELLYTAMEDNVIDILIGKGVTAKTIRIDIQPFTLICATTMPNKISKPMLDRFIHNFKLSNYSESELKTVLETKSNEFEINLNTDAANLLINVSKGTPRILINLLKKIRDHFLVSQKSEFNIDDVLYILNLNGIDKNGLTKIERLILSTINDNGNSPIGLKMLAATINESPNNLENFYEPHLINLGFLTRSHKGRLLTPKGVDYVRNNVFYE